MEEAALLPDLEDRAGLLFSDSQHPDVVNHAPSSVDAYRAHIRLDLAFVVTDGTDTPVGFAICGVLDGALHLYELGMDPDHGGKGLGRALVEIVAQEATARGLGAVTLSTFTNVPWNAPFYERVGFRILGEDEMTPALYLVRNHEADAGLTHRCVMRRDI